MYRNTDTNNLGCVEAGGIQIYIFITGMLCFIVDIIYIYFMLQMEWKENED